MIPTGVAGNLGLEHQKTIPDDDEIQAKIKAQEQAAQAQEQAAQAQAQGGGDPREAPKNERAGPEAAREEVEGDFTGPTGRPGMRAGG